MDLSDLASLEPLAGGWSGLTFRGEAAGERVVVRVYPPGLRPPAAPEVDAAVLRLVRGLLPVPDVVEVVRGDADADRPGLLLTSWVEGVRGDLLLPGLDDAALHRAGTAVGRVAGVLAGMPVLRGGAFVDGSLSLGRLDAPDDLTDWVRLRLGPLPGWTPLLGPLLEVADHAQQLLEGASRRCLVHSDLNPKNLLLDPATLEVTAVLDWEFAHAGLPTTDLGNLLRFDRHPAYVEGVLSAYRSRVPAAEAGPDLLDRARAADLWALVDLAARGGSNPVADRAEQLLRSIGQECDLHAGGPTPEPAP